jgi:hypothetical protein
MKKALATLFQMKTQIDKRNRLLPKRWKFKKFILNLNPLWNQQLSYITKFVQLAKLNYIDREPT